MYIQDKIKEFLDGKTPEEVGMTQQDVLKLIRALESGVDPKSLHFDSTPECHCNICRT